ncbi:hypothetical protein [Gracilimonas tropica]|uniref:hypothetical protein n=1 Tax=Gracilimonas tropica TaxID=454600 RepID=UPI00036F1924|nr:hypothetical protein [Gracilimonas tropica]
MTNYMFNAEFWRWYLRNEFKEFSQLSDTTTLIEKVPNVFSENTNDSFLNLNLDTEICTDSEGNEFSIVEFIAIKEDCERQYVEMAMAVDYERWLAQKFQENAAKEYERDFDNYQWVRKRGGEKVPVTDFDLILESIIEKWNPEKKEWERTYVGQLRYLRGGIPMYKPFNFEPGQTHSVEEFSKSVWNKDVLQVKNMKNEDMRSFWLHVNLEYKPRIVREFDHFGIISFEKTRYLLAGNVLVSFPKKASGHIKLIAQRDGAFPVGDNKFLKPPEDAIHLPHYELGFANSDGYFQSAEESLYDDQEFFKKLLQIEHHFCGMVGGDTDFRNWGKIIVAYVFSFVFFDEIYALHKHIIFLYLYGEGNVGKGEMAKLIQDFFGINHLDSLNTPPARSVDEALEQKSHIPQWIDEHVPQVPGKKAKIEDQIWNSWFELKPRPTNIKKGNKWGKEHKVVRTMPLFCSNFLPATDHLLSRSLIIHYSKKTRGPEDHVKELLNDRVTLQRLMLSFLKNYHLINRKDFINDMERIRLKLKDAVKTELGDKMKDVVLQDRQINQFASLVTVSYWLNPHYRYIISGVLKELEVIKDTAVYDDHYRNFTKERNDERLLSVTGQELFLFARDEVVKTAIRYSSQDPLTEFIETIGTLIQSLKVTVHHFNWTKDGTLKIWAKAIWDIYEYEKRGTDGMVRRDIVDEKLRDLSDLTPEGELKVVNWTIIDSYSNLKNDTIRQRGYYIPNAVENELFRNAFNWDKFKPAGSQPWTENTELFNEEIASA